MMSPVVVALQSTIR